MEEINGGRRKSKEKRTKGKGKKVGRKIRKKERKGTYEGGKERKVGAKLKCSKVGEHHLPKESTI